MQVFAPAKINLTLFVAPPNKEEGPKHGFHKLNSLIGFCDDCGDLLSFNKADDLYLEIKGEFASQLTPNDDNLVLRAAKLLPNKNQGAEIILYKNLPIASGIGGGSSDAAATLIGLNQLWEIGLTTQELCEIAKELGSDVPSCVMQHSLIMKSYGEVFEPAPNLPEFFIILANPLIACPTPQIYKNYDLQEIQNFLDFEYYDCGNFADSITMLEVCRNDLEKTAISLFPEIGELLASLAQLKGQKLVRMSGSGASCFAVFETIQMAQNALLQLEEIYKSKPLWARVTKIS